MNWRNLLMLAIGALLLVLCGCGWRSPPPVMELKGPAMGASYTIKVVQPPASLSKDSLREDVEGILDGVTQTFSTYETGSELSRLNHEPLAGWTVVSDSLYQVIQAAQGISSLSGGAFDVTVAPLVDLWGFGSQFRVDHIPSEPDIRRTMQRVGHQHLRLRPSSPPAVYRALAGIEIDLNALVPGYTADLIAERLEQLGVKRYLVDMGGEMRLRGMNPQGQPWQVAIEKPVQGRQELLRRLSLTDVAVSSSGNYRNFFEINGQRYSHEIDPRTGYPVSHRLASVTVIAETAMKADAWSTALLVLGPVEGLKVAERERIAALFVMDTKGDGFSEISSSMMNRHLSQ